MEYLKKVPKEIEELNKMMEKDVSNFYKILLNNFSTSNDERKKFLSIVLDDKSIKIIHSILNIAEQYIKTSLSDYFRNIRKNAAFKLADINFDYDLKSFTDFFVEMNELITVELQETYPQLNEQDYNHFQGNTNYDFRFGFNDDNNNYFG